jgi:hypothetical protein
MEIDLDVQLCQAQLPFPNRFLDDRKVLHLVLLNGYREVGRAISRQRKTVHRSKCLLDLRQGDALRQRHALLDILRLTDHDIQISVIEFPGRFWWNGDEVA